jgi:bacterioferritin-associated ferredoxin
LHLHLTRAKIFAPPIFGCLVAAMYICLCNAITDRQIVEAAHGGARTDEDLAHRLGVGITCGRCRSCAKQVLMETLARIAPDGCPVQAVAAGSAA